MTTWPFGALRMFGYDVIVADPPWDFVNYSEAGTKKGADPHYRVMPLEQIMTLRVGELARGDCLLLLWCCEWMRPSEREAVLRAWGATYKSTIIWRKTTRRGLVRMGTGYRVRTMHEPVIVATIGNPQHQPFPSIFDGVAREHSRKPDEFYALVERAAPNAFRAELFGRQSRPGWDVWGDEATRFDPPAAVPNDDPILFAAEATHARDA